tara:strand:+ start:167 stop:469 length:303 start_codon:yes stop_codon:yes gene_type:complete
MRVLSQDDNVDDNIDINNNDLIIHNISNPINEDSDDEYINSSDEEQSEDVIVLIVCSECRVEMGTNEEHLHFPSGINYCMECADLLEQTIDIYSDDELEH